MHVICMRLLSLAQSDSAGAALRTGLPPGGVRARSARTHGRLLHTKLFVSVCTCVHMHVICMGALPFAQAQPCEQVCRRTAGGVRARSARTHGPMHTSSHPHRACCAHCRHAIAVFFNTIIKEYKKVGATAGPGGASSVVLSSYACNRWSQDDFVIPFCKKRSSKRRQPVVATTKDRPTYKANKKTR